MAEVVGPNLEQLDSWGTIDTLDISLDSSDWNTRAIREVANFRNAPTLEQLDAFSSSLDAITTSLDSLTSFGSPAQIVVTSTGTANAIFGVSGSAAIAITATGSAQRVQNLYGI